MKKMIRILTATMVCCMLLCFARPAEAASLQEEAWLSLLCPSELPKVDGGTSYHAELTIRLPQLTPVTLNGICSLEGTVSDEQILSALKTAVSAVPEYKSPDDAASDKALVSDLKEKLKFSKEDMQRILQNWLALVGKDKVYEILNGRIPKFEVSDGIGPLVNGIIDAAGELAGEELDIAIPDLIINGAVVSWKEYQRDQEKYRHIVSLSQANARLRQYYDRVNELLREDMGKTAHWTIRIYDQKVQNDTFDMVYDITLPYLYTAEILLTKNGGDYSSITGTYSGDFKITIDADMSDYDANLHDYVAKAFTENDQKVGVKRNWSGYSMTINQPSESKTILEGENLSVNLSLPYGTNKTIFELPLDATKLDAHNKFLIDMVYSIQSKEQYGTSTHTWTRIEDSVTGTSYLKDEHVIFLPDGSKQEYSDVQEGAYPTVDIRPYISMTLVVDMLTDK